MVPTDDAVDSALAIWNHMANHSSPCYRCTSPGESPYHVCTSCTWGPAQAERDRVISGLPQVIGDIATKALRARQQDPAADLSAAEHARVNDLITQAQLLDWTSDQGKWILFRLLTVAPWPSSAAAPGHGLVASLGRLFDDVIAKNHRIRPLANRWVVWAGKEVLALHYAWNGRSARDLHHPMNDDGADLDEGIQEIEWTFEPFEEKVEETDEDVIIVEPEEAPPAPELAPPVFR